jgi:hypothetical protein
VLAHEIIMREMQPDRRAVVLCLLAESIGQARKPAHPHPHGEVLPFHKAGRNVLLIGITGHNVALGSDNLRRAITPRSDRLGFVEFNRLPEIDFGTERHFDSVDIAAERVG